MSALKGVNLGGWLVIEKWITPSLFKGMKATNHYQLAKSRAGKARIRTHIETFITEDDIVWLRANGVELLRVPVGYWIFGDDAPYEGAIARLDWLVETAKKYGMHVMIDMHAAANAQNSKAHSGSGNTGGSDDWLKDENAQRRTIEVVKQLAVRYRDFSNVWGIQLLNEPSVDAFGLRLVRFYRRAYKELTQVARPGMRIVFSDGFRPWLLVNTFGWLRHKAFPVVMDVHIYHCFGRANKKRTAKQHIRLARSSRRYIRLLSLFQPVMVGEWSAMLPYKTVETNTKRFIRTQQKSYKIAEAWCYWTYKTENTGRWNFRDMVERDHLELLQ